MKEIKTNAMRILDKAAIAYKVLYYEHGKEAIDGQHVAAILKQDPNTVFKTLLTIANTKEYFVFMVPVAQELDLKKCAKAAHVKSIEMIAVKEINQVSGYIRGGCSPIGMKKSYPTILHKSCLSYENIVFSAGKIDVQIVMPLQALLSLLQANTADIAK